MAALEELDQALPERAHPSCPNCGRRELRAQYIGDPTGSGTPRSGVTTAPGAPTPAGRDPSGCCWLTREDFAGGGVGERSLLNCVAMVKFSVCTVPLCTPRAFTRRRWGSDSRRVSVLGCGDALDSTVDWAKGTISGRDLLFQAGTTLVLSVVGGAAAKAGVKALERLGPKLHGWIDDALKPRLADERGTWSMADRLSPSGAPTRPRRPTPLGAGRLRQLPDRRPGHRHDQPRPRSGAAARRDHWLLARGDRGREAHLMLEEHRIEHPETGRIEVRRFDPDEDIADAWIRLRAGRPFPRTSPG